MDNIFVVNLERDEGKLNSCIKEFKKINVDEFFKFKAIDGNKLDKNEKKKKTTKFCNNFCNNSMIGCALSHINIWKYIVKNKIKQALILEDDFKIMDSKNFTKNLNNSLKELPDNWDILYLGCHGFCSKNYSDYTLFQKIFLFFYTFKFSSNKTKYKYIYKPDKAMGTHAYMINYNSAKKLLKQNKKINWHIDDTLHNNLNYFATEPMLINGDFQTSGIGAKEPFLLNEILKHIIIESNSQKNLSWALSEYLLNIFSFNIYTWHIIFFIFGIIFVLFSFNPKIMLLFFIFDFFINIVFKYINKLKYKFDTIKNYASLITFFYLPYLLQFIFYFIKNN